MYDKIILEFKSKLTDRQLGIRIVVTLSFFFVAYLIILISLLSKFKLSWISPICTISLLLACLITCYSIVFKTVKKKLNLSGKEFLHGIKVIRKLSCIQQKDVAILVGIIKGVGINTRPKVKEAIRHFQVLIPTKRNKNIAVISVISLAMSILSIILPTTNMQSIEGIFILLLILFMTMIWVALFCLVAKLIYKTVYYDLSEYALMIRIEAALSEIWMNQLI